MGGLEALGRGGQDLCCPGLASVPRSAERKLGVSPADSSSLSGARVLLCALMSVFLFFVETDKRLRWRTVWITVPEPEIRQGSYSESAWLHPDGLL